MHSPSRRPLRTLLLPAVLVALVAFGLTAPSVSASPATTLDPGLSTSGHALTKVVVSGQPGASALVRQALVAAGATDLRRLAIVNGWSARVRADRLVALDRAAGVAAVTADRAVHLTGSAWDSTVSSSPYVWNSQAGQLWSGGATGSGISVAILDTGVSPVQDLAGRVMSGPDMSGEGRNTVDSFGHGTVMAGIVAGDGSAAGSAPRTGVAPDAQIISVKVAGANGATDVSTMLAGMSWIGAFKDVYNIKVLNLSWGVPSTQDTRIDPVNFAVERLWHLGVTVVVAAGNSGPSTGTIMKPGDDPLVVTVGAYDDKGDSQLTNDSVPAWSSQGPTAAGLAKPDLVAPGRTLIATRAPGSTVETQNPNALVAPAYIKGSGSSEATAVTSGVVALLLQQHPLWTPDQVKYALTSTASRITGVATNAQGAGRLQAASATAANVLLAPTQVATATGTGTLAGSRGTSVPITITCDGQSIVLTGEMTSWCAVWDSGAWTSGAWTSGAWTSGAWTSGAWTSGAWTSGAWTSTSWSSGAWTSGAWTSGAWTSGAWTSGAWTSNDYTDTDATPDQFLTIFYGSHPKYGMHVPGEVSDPKPTLGNDHR
jgi:serine protease AprX